MGDRNFPDSKRNHNNDRSNLLLDRCCNNECSAKHYSRKRNLPFNSDISDEQIRKQSSSEEDNELDTASNYFDENDDGDNSKGEIGIGYQFHGHTATNFNTLTRGFTSGIDSICHHHSQQLVYTGHMPVNSHYVVSCSTVQGNSTSGNESSYERANTTICNFGLSRTMYGNFGYTLPSLHGMPVLASETFCAVPGRTSLLSSTTKYHVTIGEIYRRISPPECLNASLLGGILRKAKSKDGGKTLRDSLKRVGLSLPAGRRKAATVTAWTALVEGKFFLISNLRCIESKEALQMAKDFAALSEKAFPVRQIAEFVCSRMIWQDNPRECCTFIEHTRLFIKELSDIISGEFSGTILGNQQNPNPNILATPTIQHGLAHFSLLTHGFGPLAFVTVFDTLTAMLDEMLKCYDRNEQHLNIQLSDISATHIPSSRFIYTSNM
uniref:BMA-APTF-1, isoform a n=1 Tax=Brugia malayi TaxID=6279 RepID=A0A0K0IWE3_BRUMA|nr:BMA-APTF-1, isoform a [Brugia malayi]